MKKLLFHSTLMWTVLASTVGQADEPRKATQRIGDSIITVLGIEQQNSETTANDHYRIAVQLRAENIGK